jgi:hypothetical protein
MIENNLPESWELVKLVDELNFIPTGVIDLQGLIGLANLVMCFKQG